MTQEHNKGVSFRVPTLAYGDLCRAVEGVSGVVFTRRRSFFWSFEDIGSEFAFRGHDFVISTDEWDGALWIITKDGRPCFEEMQALRDAVEAAAKRGVSGRLRRLLYRKLF